jgi:thioredoxin reductase (NADPH)
LAAAVYGASDGLRVVLVESRVVGGQASLSSMIENYLGFPAGLTGTDLARRAAAQARKFDAEVVAPHRVIRAGVEGSSRVTELGDGSTLRSHAVLIATPRSSPG